MNNDAIKNAMILIDETNNLLKENFEVKTYNTWDSAYSSSRTVSVQVGKVTVDITIKEDHDA